MPVASPSGECVESSYATFMEPVRRPNSCLRVTDDLTSSCATMFDARRFTTDLYVGTAPDSVPASTGGTTKACDDDAATDDDDCEAEWVRVGISSTSYLDPDSGRTTQVWSGTTNCALASPNKFWR